MYKALGSVPNTGNKKGGKENNNNNKPKQNNKSKTKLPDSQSYLQSFNSSSFDRYLIVMR